MKTLISTLLAFFALSLCAAAQTLIGPNTGPVWLHGDPANPKLSNDAGKTIIEVVFVQHHANGFEEINRAFFGSDPGLLIKHGEHDRDLLRAVRGLVFKAPGYDPGSPVVSVTLDLVVFLDGEILGPDQWKSQQAVLDRVKKSQRGPAKLWRDHQ